jgi:hypothetical protein
MVGSDSDQFSSNASWSWQMVLKPHLRGRKGHKEMTADAVAGGPKSSKALKTMRARHAVLPRGEPAAFGVRYFWCFAL